MSSFTTFQMQPMTSEEFFEAIQMKVEIFFASRESIEGEFSVKYILPYVFTFENL